MIEDFGDLPIRSIKPKMIAAIRDKLSVTPAKANQTLALFRILLSYAERDLEAIPSNPASRPGRLKPPKREQIWSDEDIDMFMQVAEADGRLYISLRQQKTDQWVSVPVHRQLAPLLRARLAAPIVRQRVTADGRKVAELVRLLVPSPEGHVWNRLNFSRAWDATMRRMNFRIAKGLFRAGLKKDEVRTELTAATGNAAICAAPPWCVWPRRVPPPRRSPLCPAIRSNPARRFWTFICRAGRISRWARFARGKNSKKRPAVF